MPNEKGLSARIDFELCSLEDSKFRFLSMVIEVTMKHQMCLSDKQAFGFMKTHEQSFIN